MKTFSTESRNRKTFEKYDIRFFITVLVAESQKCKFVFFCPLYLFSLPYNINY